MHPEQAWAMYFASIASFHYHPRNNVIDDNKTIERAAYIADLMLCAHNLRRHIWDGQPPQP